jgi:anti-sigma B factor antagonist
MKLVVTMTEVEGSTILHCKGRLQFCEEAAVFSRLAHGVFDSGKNLVLDLSGVEIIDSSAVGDLVLIYMRACASEKEVRIAAPTPRVLEVLELTRVSSLFRIYSTVDAALGWFPELAQAVDSTGITA